MATKQKKPMAKTIIKAAVIIGVLIIPLMYSYFYLSAFWDPYSRLQDVSVAVVNLDQGAKINGKDRNVGKEICDNLEEDGSLDFHFVSEADAKDGLMNDKYYAEVLIPADLTDSISTASKNTKKQHAQIQYVANQKRNYLASQILESGMMPTIKETVNGAVNKEITATLTDKLYSVPDALEILKDGLQQLSDGAGSVKNGTQQLSTATISLNVGGALPFCTSAPQTSMEASVCTFEEPVAPPMPSRPVRPPSRMMISPGSDVSLFTSFLGAAPMTAPISMRFAT